MNLNVSCLQALNTILWITSFSIMSSIIFGYLPLQQVDTKHHIGHALYISLIRSSWNYSLVWIIFACFNGKGGIVKKFLELSYWQPLARLGLSFFLVQTIYRQYIPQMHPEYFSDKNMVSLPRTCWLVKLVLGICLQFFILLLSDPPVLRGLCRDMYFVNSFIFGSWSSCHCSWEKLLWKKRQHWWYY